MTLSATTTRIEYAGDDATTVFPTTFQFTDIDDVTVGLIDTTGTYTEWVRGTQYTMAEVDEGVAAGGDVTVKTTPTDYTPATGETLIIYRNRTFTQTSALVEGGIFDSTTVETMSDNIVMMIQALNERIGRGVILPVYSTYQDLTLPDPEAGAILQWNGNADGLENVEVADLSGVTLTLPASSTATAIPRWSGTGGDTLLDSGCIIDSSNQMGINITSPDGTLHVHTASAGTVTAHDNANDLVVEGTGAMGISIITNTGQSSNIYFGDTDDNDIGSMVYNHADNSLNFTIGTDTDAFRMEGGRAFIGDVTNNAMTAGLTINQGANDDEILAFKSSDVTHGVTQGAETDTFCHFKKHSATLGGVLMTAYSETGHSSGAVLVTGVATDDNTTHTAAGYGNVRMRAQKKSGTSTTSVGANGNLFSVDNADNTCFIVDAEGDIFYDGTAAAYDDHDDAALARAFDMVTAPDKVVRNEFDRFVAYNEKTLVDLGILGAPRSEGGLINGSQLQRLHNGAIAQQSAQMMALIETLEERSPGLKAQLAAKMVDTNVRPLPNMRD